MKKWNLFVVNKSSRDPLNLILLILLSFEMTQPFWPLAALKVAKLGGFKKAALESTTESLSP